MRAYIGTASPQAHIIPDYLKHQGLWLVACLGACTGLSPLQKRQRPRCHAIGSQHQQRQGCSTRVHAKQFRSLQPGPSTTGPKQDKKNLQEGPVHMLNPRITPLWSMGGIKTNQGCMEKLHNHGDKGVLAGLLDAQSRAKRCLRCLRRLAGITILVHNQKYIGKLLSRTTKPIGEKIKPLTAMTRGQQDTASAQ